MIKQFFSYMLAAVLSLVTSILFGLHDDTFSSVTLACASVCFLFSAAFRCDKK